MSQLKIDMAMSDIGGGVSDDQRTVLLAGITVPGGVGWVSYCTLPTTGSVQWTVRIEHDPDPSQSWGQHLVGVCDAEGLCAWGAYAPIDRRMWTMERTAAQPHLRRLNPLHAWQGIGSPYRRVISQGTATASTGTHHRAVRAASRRARSRLQHARGAGRSRATQADGARARRARRHERRKHARAAVGVAAYAEVLTRKVVAHTAA